MTSFELGPTILGVGGAVIPTEQVLLALEEEIEFSIAATNAMWVFICSFSVFFMQAGFGILEAGSVQDKNTRAILFKNMLDLCVTGLAFFLLGHHLAFGSSPSPILPFIGWDEGFGQLFWREPPQGYGHQFYMYGFQAACVTIVSGAVAERTTIPAYLFLTFILSIFVQPAVMHWVWSSDGFFSASNLGSAGGVYLIDFAGSGVVHLIGGVASFQAAKVVGPRMKPQRFKNGKAMPIPSSNASFAVLGALILWFCWFGFNAGSAMLVSEPVGEPHEACANSPFPNACMYLNGVKTPGYPVAELAMQNTAIAPMISCLTVTGIGYIMNGIRAQRRADAAKPQARDSNYWRIVALWKSIVGVLKRGKFDLNNIINGILVGAVAITGPCATVSIGVASLGGIAAGIIYVIADRLLLYLEIDDVVGAAPVHGAGGFVGLLIGSFSSADKVQAAFGRQFPGVGIQFGVQLGGACLIAAWTSFWTYIFYKLIACIFKTNKKVRDNIFRVPLELEEWGIDLHLSWGLEVSHGKRTLAEYLTRVHMGLSSSDPVDSLGNDSQYLNFPSSKAILRMVIDRYRGLYMKNQEGIDSEDPDADTDDVEKRSSHSNTVDSHTAGEDDVSFSMGDLS